MSKRKDKPMAIRLLNTVCAFMLIGSAIYIFIFGINLIPSLFLLSAIGGISGPVVLGSGDGIVECLVGVFEAFVEGVLGVFETIGDIFGSIFG